MDIGVAYYPEHWPAERWAADYALMREAGITRVRIGEFAWCRMEPREGVFAWDWLDRAIALAAEAGIGVVLCTPTQAPPPWLSHGHPKTRPWTPDGRPYAQGSRRHVEAANPGFLVYVDRIVRALGDRYGRDGRVVGWQLDNEIGAHTHFVSCHPDHERLFRLWLRRKYGSVEALNAAWGSVFWSGEFSSFDEVEVVTTAPAGKSPSYIKDFRTFGQELWIDFLVRQRDILRPLCPGQFITHNIAWYGEQVDLWRLREELDVLGIDAYQSRPELVTALADLYAAAAGDKPWAVLEMGCGTGWHRDTERAGHARGRLTALLVKYALAGANLASLFRFQTSPSGQEQGGTGNIRDAWGRPNPTTIDDIRRARDLIDGLAGVIARKEDPDVAIVWDSDNLIWSEMWPIEGRRKRHWMIDHPREIQELHHQFAKRGYRPTFVPLDQDLSRYRVVVCWNQVLMDAGQAAVLRAYVAQGGCLLAGGLMGHLTREGRRHARPVPLDLEGVFGCSVRDMLAGEPGLAPRLSVGGCHVPPPGDIYPLEVLDGGEVLADLAGLEEEHRAAVVARGRAVYVGLGCDRACWEAIMPAVFARFGLADLNPVAAHPDVECVPRRGTWIVCNDSSQRLTLAVEGSFQDLIGRRELLGELALDPFGLAVLDPT